MNRIDKLGKMIWSQFFTKVLQMIILEIKDWEKRLLSPAIYLEGCGKHFEYEYIIKLSKNLIES